MLDNLWDRLLTALDGKVPASTLEPWFRSCRLVGVDGDHLRVAAPNKYTRDWLTQQHIGALELAAREVIGGNPRVLVEVDQLDAVPTATPNPPPPRPLRNTSFATSAPGPSPVPGPAPGLSARYTFDSFVVGNSNQFAQAACQAVADLPSKAYNPLFIYGGVGLGKTHLLHAVGHQIARLYPSLRLLYLSTERFTNELINAIRFDRMGEFRAKYRNIDLLLIDDIQFISGKERTQEEFFHTFNDLYEARRQIVVSSDSAPKEIPEIEERLRSRFEWGLIADIQPPDFETRVAILKKKAEVERVLLPDDVAYLIASRIKANIREIEGSLTRMIAFCSLSGREMSIELAQDVLAELWGDEDRIITIEHIQRKAAEFFSIKLSDMRAKNRTKAVAFPRQVAMYLSRQLTHASLSDIGRSFGGKDHTTVLHAVSKLQSMIQEDTKLKQTIDTLTQGITL